MRTGGGAAAGASPARQGTFGTLLRIARAEGAAALFAGLAPRLAKVGAAPDE